jgi:hypothetical protein
MRHPPDDSVPSRLSGRTKGSCRPISSFQGMPSKDISVGENSVTGVSKPGEVTVLRSDMERLRESEESRLTPSIKSSSVTLLKSSPTPAVYADGPGTYYGL